MKFEDLLLLSGKQLTTLVREYSIPKTFVADIFLKAQTFSCIVEPTRTSIFSSIGRYRVHAEAEEGFGPFFIARMTVGTSQLSGKQQLTKSEWDGFDAFIRASVPLSITMRGDKRFTAAWDSYFSIVGDPEITTMAIHLLAVRFIHEGT